MFCGLTYFSALARVELNLQSNQENTLEKVGLIFSGPKVAWLGNFSLKILMFALLAAYLYGLSSIIQSTFFQEMALAKIVIIISVLLFLLIISSPRVLLDLNKYAIVGLLLMVISVVAIMVQHFRPETIIHVPCEIKTFSVWSMILPIIFTSFGFQGSLHSLTKICNNDIKLLKIACLWGSIIPAVVYVIWTCSVICLLNAKFPESFNKNVEVSELINLLSVACNWGFVKTLLLAISATAIATSIFGVGLCLKDDFHTFFSKILDRKASIGVSCLCTVIPGCFIAIFVPNAFIHVLSFAGMLLVVIAIFIPMFLLGKVQQSFKFKALNSKFIMSNLLFIGIAISVCEIYNIFTCGLFK
jgi:tyrosine-specific transport protein